MFITKSLCAVLLTSFVLISMFEAIKSEGLESISLRTCANRSGLKPQDIKQPLGRNENCQLDCITWQGTLLSYNIREGENCHPSGTGEHRCILGQCRRSPEDITSDDLMNVEIRVLSAYVPDMDPYPAQGESDVFVTVQVENNAGPSYGAKDILCYTYVIQDNKRPRWRNFSCKPSPMSINSKLAFVVSDSDKPAVSVDQLGVATERLKDLINSGPTKLYLNSGGQSMSKYYVEVDVVARSYQLP